MLNAKYRRGKMPGKRKSGVDEKLKKNILNEISSTEFKNYTVGMYLENNMKALEAIANKAMKYNDVFKLKGFSPYMRAYHLKKVPVLKTVAEVNMITCPYCFSDVTLESCRVDHVIPVQVYTRYLHLLLAEKKAGEGAQDLKALQTERLKVIGKTLPRSEEILTSGYIQALIKKTQDDYVTVDSLSGEIRRSFSRHHLVERGHNEYFNLLLCCHTCNSKKSNALNIDNVLMVSEAYANKKNARALAFKISSIRKVLNKIENLSKRDFFYVTESPEAVGMNAYFTGEGKTDPSTKATSSFKPFYSKYVIDDPDILSLIKKSADINDKRNRIHPYSPPEDENVTEKEGEEPEIKPGKRHTRGDTIREASLSAEAETPVSEAVREYLKLISNEFENSKRSGLSASYIDKSLKNFNSLFNEHLTGDGADFSIIKESLEKSTELKDEGTKIKDEGTVIKDEGAEIEDKGMEIEDEGTERKGDGTELKNDAPQEKVHIKKSLLKHQITTSGVKTFHGKICLYCLGVYEESAFELDHIKPVSAHKHVLSAGLYNDVINIVAVCKTCNTSKGPRPLTTDFLSERQGMIREAGNAFYFHLEHAINPETSENYTLEEGEDIRGNMLTGLIASI